MKVLMGAIFIIVFFLMEQFSVSVGFAEDVRIVSFNYPPFLISDNAGVIPEIINEAAREAGQTIELFVRPRKRAMRMFEKESGLMFLGESRYFADKSDNLIVLKLMYVRGVLVYMKKRFPAFSSADLKQVEGKIIGVSLGNCLIPFFEKQGWRVQTVRTLESNIKKLVAGRIDFWGTVGLSSVNLIREYYPEIQGAFTVLEIEKFPVELVAKKGGPEMQVFMALQKGFQGIIQNGRYQKIIEKYYGPGNVPTSAMIEL